MERKVPYGRVETGDTLYFIADEPAGLVRAKATVRDVLNSDKLTERTSVKLLQAYQRELQLTKKETRRWAGKRYLVLITVGDVTLIPPFAIDKSNCGSTDRCLPVGEIRKVKAPRWSPWLRGKRAHPDVDPRSGD
jgi:hypothetical protein